MSGRQRSLEERLVRRHGRANANGWDCTLHGLKIAIFPKPWNASRTRFDLDENGRVNRLVGCTRRNYMFDHISIGVRDIAKAKAFYDAALKPLGLTCLSADETSLGYGKEAARFWVNSAERPVPDDPKSGLHFCFTAPSRQGVEALPAKARRWRMAGATTASREFARIMGRTITPPSSLTPKATGSKPIMGGNRGGCQLAHKIRRLRWGREDGEERLGKVSSPFCPRGGAE